MGNICSKTLFKVRNQSEDCSSPLHHPTYKKPSIVRTTDDMPSKKISNASPIKLKSKSKDIERFSSENENNHIISIQKTPRTIVNTTILQKRRNSEVFKYLFIYYN